MSTAFSSLSQTKENFVDMSAPRFAVTSVFMLKEGASKSGERETKHADIRHPTVKMMEVATTRDKQVIDGEF